MGLLNLEAQRHVLIGSLATGGSASTADLPLNTSPEFPHQETNLEQFGEIAQIPDPEPQHAQLQLESEPPWNPYDVAGINQFAFGQVTCPSPTTKSPYGHDELKARSRSIDYQCSSQPATLSVSPEPSSILVQEHISDGYLTLDNPIAVDQKQVHTYAQIARLGSTLASVPTYSSEFLATLRPNEPEDEPFFKNTMTDIPLSRSPSTASKLSDGRISWPRRPPRNTTEFHGPPYICQFCDKKFSIPGDRNHHEAIHGEPSFVCPECGMGFLWQKDLKRHMPTHTKVKEFECRAVGCVKRFTRRDNRRRHEEKHHSNFSGSSGSSQLDV